VSGAVGVPGADVLVRRGDTLWDIAASQLPRGCTNAQIAAAWPRWYRHNRRVIGPNPHLIIPGMRLLPPARIEAVTR
jgi:Tfp pilus assembly protein FimV